MPRSRPRSTRCAGRAAEPGRSPPLPWRARAWPVRTVPPSLRASCWCHPSPRERTVRSAPDAEIDVPLLRPPAASARGPQAAAGVTSDGAFPWGLCEPRLSASGDAAKAPDVKYTKQSRRGPHRAPPRGSYPSAFSPRGLTKWELKPTSRRLLRPGVAPGRPWPRLRVSRSMRSAGLRVLLPCCDPSLRPPTPATPQVCVL